MDNKKTVITGENYVLEKKDMALLIEVEDAEALMDLLMIAKYFERIGDHAENIAEWVIYSITGKHQKVSGNKEELE